MWNWTDILELGGDRQSSGIVFIWCVCVDHISQPVAFDGRTAWKTNIWTKDDLSLLLFYSNWFEPPEFAIQANVAYKEFMAELIRYDWLIVVLLGIVWEGRDELTKMGIMQMINKKAHGMTMRNGHSWQSKQSQKDKITKQSKTMMRPSNIMANGENKHKLNMKYKIRQIAGTRQAE